MFDSDLIKTIVITAGGIATGYFAFKAKAVLVKPPKDRVETIFDGYEALIKQQQAEIIRKGILIDKLEEQLNKMEEIVEQLKSDLSTSQSQIEGLSSQLSEMKSSYSKLRETDTRKSALNTGL